MGWIAELLYDELYKTTCHTCRYLNYDEYCESCHKKSMGWAIDGTEAERLEGLIIKLMEVE